MRFRMWQTMVTTPTNPIISIAAVFLLVLTTTALLSYAADPPLDSPDDSKKIDVRLMTETLQALRDFRGEARTRVIQGIRDHPENFAPPVLYFLSSALFEQGKKDEAVFWFHAGQLRGRIDANISTDKSAGAGIDSFDQKFGPAIKQYSLQNIPALTNTIERVLVWEEKTPFNYDRRWINLPTMTATTGETNSAMSAPLDEWEPIRKRTREEYRATFYQALDEFNHRKH